MPRSNRLKLSLAGTAAVALASLPLGITPASAAKVSEGTTSSIGVVEDASNAQQFNLKTQGASTVLVARGGRDGVGAASVSHSGLKLFNQLMEFFQSLIPRL
ncbi:MAG: hypothetical protein NTV57_06175 [Cyanobacteria bacterium]|nr:hypothetical protein [Cyanobacteriota bacterium]